MGPVDVAAFGLDTRLQRRTQTFAPIQSARPAQGYPPSSENPTLPRARIQAGHRLDSRASTRGASRDSAAASSARLNAAGSVTVPGIGLMCVLPSVRDRPTVAEKHGHANRGTLCPVVRLPVLFWRRSWAEKRCAWEDSNLRRPELLLRVDRAPLRCVLANSARP